MTQRLRDMHEFASRDEAEAARLLRELAPAIPPPAAEQRVYARLGRQRRFTSRVMRLAVVASGPVMVTVVLGTALAMSIRYVAAERRLSATTSPHARGSHASTKLRAAALAPQIRERVEPEPTPTPRARIHPPRSASRRKPRRFLRSCRHRLRSAERTLGRSFPPTSQRRPRCACPQSTSPSPPRRARRRLRPKKRRWCWPDCACFAATMIPHRQARCSAVISNAFLGARSCRRPSRSPSRPALRRGTAELPRAWPSNTSRAFPRVASAASRTG